MILTIKIIIIVIEIATMIIMPAMMAVIMDTATTTAVAEDATAGENL